MIDSPTSKTRQGSQTNLNSTPETPLSQETGTQPPRYRWVVMGFLWSLNLVIPITAMSIGVMLPSMTKELGITPVQAGMLGGVWFFGSAVVSLPASIWLSRYSPKRITFLSLLLSGCTVLLQGWAPAFISLLVFRFLFVIVAVSRMQAEVLLIHQWFEPRQIGTVLGVSTGMMVIGQMIAVGLTPYLLIALSGWRNVYYALGLIMIAMACLWVIIGRERAQSRSTENKDNQDQSPINVLRKYKFLWILAAAPSGAALAFSAVMTFWPTLALETLPLSLTEVGSLMTVFLLGGMAAAFTAAPLSSRIRRRKPFLWLAGILLPPLYIALFTTNSIFIAGLLLFLAGWNAQIWVPIIRTIPFDLQLAPRETAVATGLGMTLLPVVGAMGPPLVGLVQEITGSLEMGLLSIVAFPLTLVIGGFLIPETSPNRDRTTTRDSKH